MISLSKHITKTLMAAPLAAALLASCYNYDNEEVVETVLSGEKYINLTIAVSTGSETQTRAPLGGENGDGREAGFVRENYVNGVTIVFYQNSDGINATASSTPALADTKVEIVKYYPVTNESRDPQGTEYSAKTDEAIYSTGEQKVTAADGFDFTKSYRVLVIANANLTSEISKGDLLSTVRDKVRTAALYDGTGLGAKANTFIMTSENDVVLNFAASGVKTIVKDGDYSKEVYTFTGIRIERMAARIDFSTQYSYKEGATDKYAAEYKTQDKSSHNYAYPGYVYPVYKTTDTDGNPTSTDRFVVTGIVPFNLSLTNTGCSEYLFKRTNDAASPYLQDESTTNWVLDPQTSTKTGSAHPAWMDYNLTTIVSSMTDADPRKKLAAEANYLTTASYQASGANAEARYDLKVSGTNTADNLIVAYPKENTLMSDGTSKLFYYATGLAIEGYYYAGDDATATPTRYVYIGYLRHQDSEASYVTEQADDPNKTAVCPAAKAMNFGVVRNNIYRVSIHKINEKGSMELKIKVKKYDEFIHEFIYM